MYWSQNFLAVVFKKQKNSQQVVARMQDLTSEFSKKFSDGDTPNFHIGMGRPPPALNTQPGLFSRGCAPATGYRHAVSCSNLGQVIHTRVPLSLSSIIWY